MSTLEIIDNSNDGKPLKVKLDVEDYNRLKHHVYIVDKTSERPYREETINGAIKRIFLVRDVLNCTYGDGRVVYSKNRDPLDCRRDNLEEGKMRVSSQRLGKMVFWPHTFNSFLNFLDARKGDDEDLVHLFLSKAFQVKYTHKMIALTYTPDDYLEFQTKKVLVTLKRVLHKYFEWSGNISIIKDATLDFKNKSETEKKEDVDVKDCVDGKPPLMQKVFSDLNKFKEREKDYQKQPQITYEHIKSEITSFIDYDNENSLRLLRDPRIFPLEHLLTVVNERMPMALQIGNTRRSE